MKPLFLSAMCAFCAFGAALLVSLPARAQNDSAIFNVFGADVAPLRGTLRAGGKGFLIEPPQLIAGSGVRQVIASANGSRVLVLRQYYPPTPDLLLGKESASPYLPQMVPGEASLIVWNAFSRKGGILWRQRIEAGQQFVFWTSGTLHGASGDRILVSVIVERPNNTGEPAEPTARQILLVDAEKNTVRQINVLPADFGLSRAFDYGQMELSTTLPFAALLGLHNATVNTLRFLRPDGSLTSPIALPGTIAWSGWAKNGTVLQGSQLLPKQEGSTVAVRQWFEADPQTGTLTRLPARPETPTEHPKSTPLPTSQLRLTSRPPLSQTGAQDSSVWLEAKEGPQEKGEKSDQALLLMGEGQPVFLLPRAALFLSNGALFAAPIQTIRDDELTQIETKQSRAKKVRIAKQLGLALLGFIQDNDEKFPASASGLAADIGPYLRDPSMLNGFVYTPPTPLSQAGMENVSQTVLGYLPGVGGKAVLYADGHVKWQDNP